MKIIKVYLNDKSIKIKKELREKKINLSDFINNNINNFIFVDSKEIGKAFKQTTIYDKNNLIEKTADKHGLSRTHLINLIINQNG